MVAESTLYVCPGFYPGIVTFDDGSSIVLGALQSYIYAQKLDERGYYQWMSPLQVFYNDSSFITDVTNPSVGNWGGWVSDGDGGVILFWYDHRGAYQDQQSGHWYNNAIYIQRVDRYGVARWMPGGILVRSAQTGAKSASITTDGQGGVILCWTERGFGYPGSPNRENLIAARYDSQGQEVWQTTIDSSTTEYWLQLPDMHRGGSRLYLRYLLNLNNVGRIIDTNGSVITPDIPVFGIGTEGDSLAYLFYGSPGFTIYKFGSTGDTIWVTQFERPLGCSFLAGFIPDGNHGVHFMFVCSDTVFHINSAGVVTRRYFPGIIFPDAQAFGDGSGIVAVSATTAKRFDAQGMMIWPSPVVYLQDPDNTYFELYASDNNGGVITAFWTIQGGIYAHHTGRNGQVGIVTSIPSEPEFPRVATLFQNFPNPFNPSTVINYELPTSNWVTLKVFDVLGREAASLVDGFLTTGEHSVTFDAQSFATGLYFYRLNAGSFTATRKLLLVR